MVPGNHRLGNHKQVKIVKLPALPARSPILDDRERDMRPGRFAVTGSFIKLPDRSESNLDMPQRN
jgi:hypothetical protein